MLKLMVEVRGRVAKVLAGGSRSAVHRCWALPCPAGIPEPVCAALGYRQRSGPLYGHV